MSRLKRFCFYRKHEIKTDGKSFYLGKRKFKTLYSLCFYMDKVLSKQDRII